MNGFLIVLVIFLSLLLIFWKRPTKFQPRSSALVGGAASQEDLSGDVTPGPVKIDESSGCLWVTVGFALLMIVAFVATALFAGGW
jgi:hypothetical protein